MSDSEAEQAASIKFDSAKIEQTAQMVDAEIIAYKEAFPDEKYPIGGYFEHAPSYFVNSGGKGSRNGVKETEFWTRKHREWINSPRYSETFLNLTPKEFYEIVDAAAAFGNVNVDEITKFFKKAHQEFSKNNDEGDEGYERNMEEAALVAKPGVIALRSLGFSSTDLGHTVKTTK